MKKVYLLINQNETKLRQCWANQPENGSHFEHDKLDCECVDATRRVTWRSTVPTARLSLLHAFACPGRTSSLNDVVLVF